MLHTTVDTGCFCRVRFCDLLHQVCDLAPISQNLCASEEKRLHVLGVVWADRDKSRLLYYHHFP